MSLLSDLRVCGRAQHAGSRRDFARSSASAHSPPDPTIEPVHAEIRLYVETEESRASREVTHAMRVRQEGARFGMSRERVDAILDEMRPPS